MPFQYEYLTTRTLQGGVGNIVNLDAGSATQASWQYWVKRENASAWGYLIDGGPPNKLQWRFYLDGGTGTLGDFGIFIADSGTSGKTSTVSLTTELAESVWHHVVVTFDAGVVKLYIDDTVIVVPDPVGGWPTALQSFDGSAQMGRNQTSGSGNIVDTLWSNFAIWYGTKLTQTEVTALYNSGTPANLLCAFAAGAISAEPTHWWRLGDSDAYPTCADSASGAQDADFTSTFATIEDNMWVLDVPGDGLEVYECPGNTQCLNQPPGSLRIYQKDSGWHPGYLDDGSKAEIAGPVTTLRTAFDGGTELTFLFWTKMNVVENVFGHVVNWGDKNAFEAAGFGFELGQGTPSVRFHFTSQQNGTAPRISVDSMLVMADHWDLIAVTVDLAEAAEIDRANFYKGSTGLFTTGKAKFGTIPSAFTETANALTLGQPHEYLYWPHRGQYLQVGIYDVKLSAANITTIYNGGTPFPSLVGISGVPDPIMSWQLDQDLEADQVGEPTWVTDVTSEILPAIHPGGVSAGCDPVPAAPPSILVQPSSDTFRGGTNIILIGDGLALQDGSHDETFRASRTLPAGWTTFGDGTVTVDYPNGVIATATGTDAGLTAPNTYSYGDVSVDVEIKKRTGAHATPVELACLELVDGTNVNHARLCIMQGSQPDPSATVIAGFVRRAGFSDTPGHHQIVTLEGTHRLRLVRNGTRIWGYHEQNGVVTTVLDHPLLNVTALNVRLVTRTLGTTTTVSALWSDFVVASHASINDRLLASKTVPSLDQIIGKVPEATLEEVGDATVDVFGIFGTASATTIFDYTLPTPKTLSADTTGRVRAYNSSTVRDGGT